MTAHASNIRTRFCRRSGRGASQCGDRPEYDSRECDGDSARSHEWYRSARNRDARPHHASPLGPRRTEPPNRAAGRATRWLSLRPSSKQWDRCVACPINLTGFARFDRRLKPKGSDGSGPGAVADAPGGDFRVARRLAALRRLAPVDAAGEAVDQPNIILEP